MLSPVQPTRTPKVSSNDQSDKLANWMPALGNVDFDFPATCCGTPNNRANARHRPAVSVPLAFNDPVRVEANQATKPRVKFRGTISPAVGGNRSTGSMAVADETGQTSASERDSRERPAPISAGLAIQLQLSQRHWRGSYWGTREGSSPSGSGTSGQPFQPQQPQPRGRVRSGTVGISAES